MGHNEETGGDGEAGRDRQSETGDAEGRARGEGLGEEAYPGGAAGRALELGSNGATRASANESEGDQWGGR